jgi:mitogen-activated protein kinase kinase kinase
MTIPRTVSLALSLLLLFGVLTDHPIFSVSYKWIKGDLIGRGTYGHVYIALSVTTGETIAVKQVEMPRTYSDKEDQRTKGMISSLKAEIELLKDLDHPNIVLYLGVYRSY